MSSLWTPGGDVPVNRESSDAGDRTEPTAGAGAGAGDQPTEEEIRAAYEQMQRQLIETPAAEVVAREAIAIYELATLHLSQPEPRLPDARLAIDALAGLLDAVGDRLGEPGQQLRSALPELRLAYVQRADQGSPEASSPGGGSTSEAAADTADQTGDQSTETRE